MADRYNQQQQDEYIEVTDERLALLQKMSSEFHQGVYDKAMREYVEMEMKLIDGTLDFGYKTIQVIGIVAGFGFTALGLVNKIGLFIVGELFLVGSIVYGIHRIKKFYTTELEGITRGRVRVGGLLREKSQIFQDVIPKAVKERKINITEFQARLESAEAKILKEFSDKQDEVPKSEGRFLDVMVILLIFGSVILLSSFTDLSWLARFVDSCFLFLQKLKLPCSPPEAGCF